MEPAKPGLVHDVGSDDAGPLGAAVTVAHGGVRIIADSIAGVKDDSGGLDSVGGNPSEQVPAKAQTVLVVEVIVEFAEAQVLRHGTGDHSEVPGVEHIDRSLA